MMKDDLASGYASSASEHVDDVGDKDPDEGECLELDARTCWLTLDLTRCKPSEIIIRRERHEERYKGREKREKYSFMHAENARLYAFVKSRFKNRVTSCIL